MSMTELEIYFLRSVSVTAKDSLSVTYGEGENAIDVDYMMHVNSSLQEKGFVMIFNPKDTDVTEKIELPLYYTGLTEIANIRQEESKAKKYKLDREYKVEVDVSVKANSYTWLVVE